MNRSTSATLNVVECDQAVVDVADHNDQSFCSSIIDIDVELLSSPRLLVSTFFVDAVRLCDTLVNYKSTTSYGRTDFPPDFYCLKVSRIPTPIYESAHMTYSSIIA
jgi:hypothetical protein